MSHREYTPDPSRRTLKARIGRDFASWSAALIQPLPLCPATLHTRLRHSLSGSAHGYLWQNPRTDKLALWAALIPCPQNSLPSEFSTPTTTTYSPHLHLLKRDIFLSKNSLLITIRASKGDPFRATCTLPVAATGFSIFSSAGNVQISIPVQARPVSTSIYPQYGRVPHLSSPHCSHQTTTPGYWDGRTA